MRDLIAKLAEYMPSPLRPRYRPKREHNASDNQKCLRDQYWSWKGEPKTNPTDLVGACKMFVGDAIEKGLVDNVLSKLHIKGYHLLSTQVPVGGNAPAWNGYLDCLMAERDGEKLIPFVVEIKTKSGFGADWFFKQPEPDKGYMIQLGLYLRNTYAEKKIKNGCFLYVLLSDANFGTFVQINCEYVPETDEVIATDFSDTTGRTGRLDVRVNLVEALKRWEALDYHLAKNETPPGEYTYRFPINDKTLFDMSDAAVKKLAEGIAAPGQWQVRYSAYKDKQLAVDGISAEITNEEKALARQEYKRRHPRSKV